MKLTFKIDKKYDEEMIFELLPSNNIKTALDETVEVLRIDKENLEKKIKKYSSNIKNIVHAVVEEKYEKILPFIENSVHSYQYSWNQINDAFSSLVEEKTSFFWEHKEYFCVVSAFHEGISSWGGDTIARRWSINADTQRPVTAHEVVLSHFWTMLENNPISKNWDDDTKWKYSEIFSWCLLGLNDEFYKFWPWLLNKHRWPLNHEYPEIVPLQKRIGVLHKKYKNFKDFFEASIKLQK